MPIASNSKKRQQQLQQADKKKKNRHSSTTTTTATTVKSRHVIATHPPIAPIVVATPIPAAPEAIVVPNAWVSSPSPAIAATAAAASINKIEDPASYGTAANQSSSSFASSNSSTTTHSVAQIAAPIVSVFGGVALVAAAIFYVARRRKRNSMVSPAVKDSPSAPGSDSDSEKLHDISLSDNERNDDDDDEDDEAIAMNNKPPALSPLVFTAAPAIIDDDDDDDIDNTDANSKTLPYQPNHYTSIYIPETDATSMVDSAISRTNSVATHKSHPSPLPALSYRNSYRSSTASSIYADAMTRPSSAAVGAHMSSFFMIAERQQLQHQRPSILDHFNHELMITSRSTPIETYKAQLTQWAIDDDDDDDNDSDNDTIAGDKTIVAVLPFSTVADLSQVYY